MVITMSKETADSLTALLGMKIWPLDTAERLSWIVRILRHMSDVPEFFPKGKWATIQHLEDQLEDAAKLYAVNIEEEKCQQ